MKFIQEADPPPVHNFGLRPLLTCIFGNRMALSLMRPNLLVLEDMHSPAGVPTNNNIPCWMELVDGAD